MISTNIRNLRLSKGYKQEYVAQKTAMTQANYSKIESGQIDPSIQQIEKLAEIFGTTTDEIIHGVKEIKIEHNNYANSNNKSTNNGISYYQQKNYEWERKHFQQTIDSQKQTIESQKITIEVLLKRIEELKSK